MPVDNPVFAFLNKMTDLIVLNLLFVICCIPIVTIGPAISAMYYVNLRSIRYGDGYVVRTFFKAFRESFKQSFVAWLITMALGILFFIDVRFWTLNDFGSLSTIMAGVSIFFAFLCWIVTIWLFPLIAKTTNPLKVQIKNAAAMAAGHFFPYTLICVVVLIGAGYMAYTSLAADVVLLLIGFALISYMLSFFIYKVFAKYMDEEPVGEDDPLYGNPDKNRYK